ncbi:MAG TPA: hypothetical protein EYN66_08365 [Myxococcales bacterium]|jgi:hypothetical protein|nr:hypothetical protein [Myxococcales bacterium]
MADVDASGVLVSTRFHVIPLLNTAQTEGSLEEIKSDVNYTGAATSAGEYGTTFGPYQIASAKISAENQMSYAFVRSGGAIKAALPISKTCIGGGPYPLPKPVWLAAGDQVVAVANTSTDREVALSVCCASGRYACFSVTPTGAAQNELIHVISGQSLGQTLTGETIIAAFVSSEGSPEVISGSGVFILDGSDRVVGSVAATDTTTAAAHFQPNRIPVLLNTRAVVQTDA